MNGPLNRRMLARALLCATALMPVTAAAQDAPPPEPSPQMTVAAQPAAAQPAAPPDEAAIANALLRYRNEPTAAQLVEAARRALRDNPGRMDSMASRARSAGWIPRVQMTVRRGQAVDLSASAAQDGSVRTSTDDDLMLQGVLSFDLPRLLFARAEVSIASEKRAQRAGRLDLMREVVALYYERRRLQLERDLGGGADLSLHARVMELEALLDAFTNGALSRMMARAKDGKPPSIQTLRR